MHELPQDLADALQTAGLAGFFADCTAVHRREYLSWIAQAKRPETRRTRIAKTLQMLSKNRAQEEACSSTTR